MVEAVSLVAASVGVLLAGSAHAAPAGVREDFNGDGYGDLAVADPYSTATYPASALPFAVAWDAARAKGSFPFGARTLGTDTSGAWLGDAFPR